MERSVSKGQLEKNVTEDESDYERTDESGSRRLQKTQMVRYPSFNR